MLISLGGVYSSKASGDLLAQVIALFGGADVGALIVPDPNETTLWQDEAKSVAATADGDPVWWVDDLSGKGNHFPAPISAHRPTLRTDGTAWWLEHTGFVRLTIPDTGLAGLSSTFGWSTFKDPFDDGAQNRGMLRGTESNSTSTGHWFFVFGDGETSSAYNAVSTAGTIYMDNVSTTVTTRDDAHTQIITNAPIIASGTVLGTGGAWDDPGDTNYLLSYTPLGSGAANYNIFEGDLFAYFEIGRVLTANERATLNDFLNDRQRVA